MRIWVILIVAGCTLPSAADTLRDPTQPLRAMKAATASSDKGQPALTSVLIAADRRVAVIDGVSLIEGSRHAGIELIEVSATGARIRKDGRLMQLTLSGSYMTKERRSP